MLYSFFVNSLSLFCPMPLCCEGNTVQNICGSLASTHSEWLDHHLSHDGDGEPPPPRFLNFLGSQFHSVGGKRVFLYRLIDLPTIRNLSINLPTIPTTSPTTLVFSDINYVFTDEVCESRRCHTSIHTLQGTPGFLKPDGRQHRVV